MLYDIMNSPDMKLLYATSISYPSRLANRLQTVEMARQFDRLIPDFILGGHSIVAEGIQRIKNFGGSTRSFILGFRYTLFARKNQITHIFCREDKLLFCIMMFGHVFGYKPKISLEIHDVPQSHSYFFNALVRKVHTLIVLTSLAKEDLVQRGISPEKIQVVPDGVDLKMFTTPISREESRKTLGLPLDKKIVLYTGHLYDWKGVDTLADAATELTDDVHVYFVGGTEKDIASFKGKHINNKHITIVGYVEHSQIPLWLWASDVLVLPNSARQTISSRYTSPLKLFEYMAANRPLVASDLPSMRDILDDTNAHFFKADDHFSLAATIQNVLGNPDVSIKKSSHAFKQARLYTWEKRAEKIIDTL